MSQLLLHTGGCSEVGDAAQLNVGAIMARSIQPLTAFRRALPKSVLAAKAYDYSETRMDWVREHYRDMPKCLERAIELRSNLPTREQLAALSVEIEQQLFDRAEPAEIAFFIGVMFDVMQKKDSPGMDLRGEMLIHVLETSETPFSAPIIAHAVLNTIKTSKFIPAISEFLETCRDERLPTELLVGQVGRVLKLHDQLDRFVRETSDYLTSPVRRSRDAVEGVLQ